MNLKASKYLEEHIQKKYPRYWDKIDGAERIHFIGSIANNSSFKKYDVDSVLSGKCDVVIDKLVDKYAQVKISDVWLELISEYLSDYIKNRYPMYYNAIHPQEFKEFVKNIALNSAIKERGLNAVLSGDADKIINGLVVEYAKLRLTNTWANFGSLCNYIKDIIVKEVGEDVSKLNETTLNDIVREIALGVCVNSKKEYSEYMIGSYDKIFLTNFDAHYDEINSKCYNRIKKVMGDASVKVTFDEDTYIEILDDLLSDLIKNYNKDEILSGACDKKIITKYNELVEQKREQVQAYIKSVIQGMMLILGVPIDRVVADLTKMVMDTKELSASKMLAGKLDRLIEGYAERAREKVETSRRQKTIDDKEQLQADVDATKRYIFDKIKTETEGMNISSQDKSAMTRTILKILCEQYGQSYRNILDGKCDSLITNLIVRNAMAYASVKGEGKQSRRKRGKKKSKISKALLALILAAIIALATAIGAATIKIGGAIYDSVGEFVQDVQGADAKKAVDRFDGFDYSYIYIKGTNAFEPTARNTVDFYQKVAECGYEDPEYYYLGFYRAYVNVRDDRLFIMDTMLSRAQHRTEDMEGAESFYEGIASDSCFLEFAINRLKALGCEKINDEKYDGIVSAYLSAKGRASKGKTPMDCMSKEDVDLATEIMKMYAEYSEDKMVEFGELCLASDEVAKVVTLAGVRRGA